MSNTRFDFGKIQEEIDKIDAELHKYNNKNQSYYASRGNTEYYEADRIVGAKKNDQTNPKDLQGLKKTPLSLIPPSALIYLGEAFREGSEKYGSYNWRSKKVQYMIYLDAILRHTLALIDGENIDPESLSGKHHLAGIMASAAILVDAIESGNVIDNRPPKPITGAPELLQRFKKGR